ncbi:MAG: 4-amino-4-deoxychorismate lyase [Gammaproteobacteria bacterium]|jgi:4-amino-4-deoxychorismate lyase
MPESLINEPLINEALEWQERGLHYGDGLFETLLKVDGEVPYWLSHYQRLVKGCKQLYLPIPDYDWLENKVTEVTNNTDTCVVKIIVTRGLGGRGLNLPYANQSSVFVLSYPYTQPSITALKVSVCDTKLPINPNLSGLKHLNRLDYILATIELSNKQDKDEAILCDTEGFIVEGIISNLFFIKDGQLFTPSLSLSGVDGIMRSKIIEHSGKIGKQVHIDRFKLDQLLQADESFLCNSVQGIRPIGSINGQAFETGTISRLMMKHFNHGPLPNV